MAPIRAIVLRQLYQIRRERRRRQLRILSYIINRRKMMLQMCLALLLITSPEPEMPLRSRSCRRLERRSCWWNFVWSTYPEQRFKNTFRISRNVFTVILDKIRHELEKDTVTEQPISPAFRLGICLYRLARGDYYYTLSETRVKQAIAFL